MFTGPLITRSYRLLRGAANACPDTICLHTLSITGSASDTICLASVSYTHLKTLGEGKKEKANEYFSMLVYITPVSYTHLDVYKRQVEM